MVRYGYSVAIPLLGKSHITTDTTTTNISADYELTRQLVRALAALENNEDSEEFGVRYDLVQDIVTALSQIEVTGTRAALARAAALITDLYRYFDDFTVATKERDLDAERLSRSHHEAGMAVGLSPGGGYRHVG
jgi:hypothetical protein